MKKSFLALSCAFTLMIGINSSNAQALSEGSVCIDLYSGFPNILNTVLKTNLQAVDLNNELTLSSVPTVGLRAGYMVSERISAGIDVNYSSLGIGYNDPGTGFDYDVDFTRLRLLARFEIHFPQNETFDLYLPLAAGYHSLNITLNSNDPDTEEQLDDINSVLNLFNSPYAFRIGIGGRYYFTDNIGLNMEFGIGGGPLVEGGIAIRL